MGKNIIFVFSGTGNSLWAAKEIAAVVGDCELATMGSNGKATLPEGYDSIGFVYPTYAGGVPKRVKVFTSNLDLQHNKNAYYYAVATCGNTTRAENVITQLSLILKRKGLNLSYGDCLRMFSNYVVRYEMRDTVLQEAK